MEANSHSAAPTTVTRNIGLLASSAAERFPDRVAVRHKRDGKWQQATFGEVGAIVEEMALGLMALGIQAGDRVCILADTRPEWAYVSLAISSVGAVVVPIYPTNSPEECEWVAGNSGACAVVCEDATQLSKVATVRQELDELESVIVIEAADAEGAVIALDDLVARGESQDRGELERRRAAIEPDDVFIIIYTSGTTGPPKGCVLTHGNGAAVCQIVEELEFVGADDTSYLYLPLAHVFAQTVLLGSFDVGGSIAFFGGDTKQIVAELGEVKPTYLPSVPRIFEKLYGLATARVEGGSPGEQEEFHRAVALGAEVRRTRQRGEEVPEELAKAFEEADERIFAGVRELLGGRVVQAVTGAAPIAAEILEFFYACGVPVLEGWGMTETTGVGTIATRKHFRFGTVGRPVPGAEVRIADDGEILMRGPNVYREYWRNPEATAETLIGGWLHSGDLGEIDVDGYLSITGRKKDIIITAGGKNLAPANLENDLKQSRWISQAVMHGDRRPYPVALITLDEEEIQPWAEAGGLPTDLAALAEHERVRELIQAEFDRANAKYAQVEQIKKFTILGHDLAQESGELTPTLKVKRKVINEKYAELFDAMY